MSHPTIKREGYDRQGLKRFINRYNIQSYEWLQKCRAEVASNLMADILSYDKAKRRLSEKRWPALYPPNNEL